MTAKSLASALLIETSLIAYVKPLMLSLACRADRMGFIDKRR